METWEDPVRFVLIGTEKGIVQYVEVLMEPIHEELAIEKAKKMVSENSRDGVEVTVWDSTLHSPIRSFKACMHDSKQR